MGGSSKFLKLLSSPVCSNIRLLSSFLSFSSSSAFLSLARGHCRVPLSYDYTVKNRRFSARTSCTGLGFSVKASEQLHTEISSRSDYGDVSGFSQSSCFSHPWPEWVRLLDHLRSVGYFDREIPKVVGEEEIFSSFEELSEEFVRAANACLTFARDRSDLLGSLSRKDVEVVVGNGSPFLFKNTINSTRRMRAFLVNDRENVLEFDRANTVDLMRFLLSYAFNALSASNQNNIQNWDFIETSVRNLLIQLLDVSGPVGGSISESMPRRYAGRPEQSTPRPHGQNIEMKKGDWICPKCSFMNFAKNTKCLECIEARPRRVLTGGEWECPQCDFFNYGRNTVCLRCDCKRPGPGETNISSAPNSGLVYNQKPNIGYASDIRTSNKSEMESRLAINDEKAERWFSKVSQLNDVSDLSSAIADEDFPEIMPLRKGINRFVVSTRKTPLERRLANAQYRRNMDNGGSKGNDLVGNVGGMGSDKTETSISQSLDKILGRSETYRSPAAENSDQPAAGDKIIGTDDPKYDPLEGELASSHYRQSLANQGRDSDYVPFTPLPADMFAKSKKAACENNNSDPAKAEEFTGSASVNSETAKAFGSGLSEKTENETEKKGDGKINDSSERYFKKFVELHDITDLTSAISDPDFPEIMPIRQGENGFVISKDHSLTSTQYKRHLAMEQANSSNFVPFVPFPPDYFAKKDKQPASEALTRESPVDTSTVSAKPENLSGSPIYNERSQVGGSYGVAGNPTPQPENLQNNREKWNGESTRIFESKTNAAYGVAAGNSTQRPEYLLNDSERWNRESKVDAAARNPSKQPENLQNRENWNRGFSGKSLEGSAVKEPNLLDMSEEAKAERWFRRVAQIKDISELSQIPDEDFPEIMPMRKGVNRFVVSKRKTPLERRLTSPQYRRNLPIVSSDPDKKC